MLFKDDHFDNVNNSTTNSVLCGDTISNSCIDQMSVMDDENDNLIKSPIDYDSQEENKDKEWDSPTLFDGNNSNIDSTGINCSSKCNTPNRILSQKDITLNISEVNSNTSNKLSPNDRKSNFNIECDSNLNNLNDKNNDDVDASMAAPVNNDIPGLYKYVNEIYSNTLSNKKTCETLGSKMFELTNRVESMLQQFSEFKSNIAGRVLGIEIKLESIEKNNEPKLTGVHKKIEVNKTRIDNILKFENVCQRYDEYINEINEKMDKYQKDLKKSQEVLQDIMKSSKSEVKYHEPRIYKKVDYTDATFNHDVVFLVDSNLDGIIPDIMDAKNTCTKFFTPTLAHIDFLLKGVKIMKQPKYVFIHCGTNHLSHRNQSTTKLEDTFIDTISNIRNLLPNSKIIISSLLPRLEPSLTNPVKYMNDFFHGVCSTGEGLSFMRNVNIKPEMLVDNKHENDDGFRTMLQNIRFKIFNKIPYNPR